MKEFVECNKGRQFEPQSQHGTEPFGVNPDGNYVGADGFIVPKNFAEFYAKNSHYVRRWASRWLHKSQDDEAVRDWEQDLLLYLHHLPEASNARKLSDRHPEGCTDVIQRFDPYRQYGASERRFRNFLNICLHNRSLSIAARMRKNPLCRKDNLSFGAMSDSEGVLTVDDEYIHDHSEFLQRKSTEQSSTVEMSLLVKRFMEHVLEQEPRLHDTVLAISETGTLREAQDILRVDEATFTRNRRRIIQLKDAFMDSGPIPKQRKPYKKRVKVRAPISTA